MGDPKKPRRQYDRPTHPWRIERITEENTLCAKYGLKNKKEVWRATSMLRKIRKQARHLLSLSGEEVEKESKDLMKKLDRLGILSTKNIDDVLGLTVENILDRRLQTLVHQKGLATTPYGARQLITHGHVIVGEKAVSVPGYLVPKEEEKAIKLTDKIKVAQSG